MPFPHVFEPLTIRHRTLRSRINFGAHTANMAEGGLPGDRHVGYYRERALGGAGMIVVEPVPVHRTAVLTRGNFRHDDDFDHPGLPTSHRHVPRGQPRHRDDPAAVSRRAARRRGRLLRSELVAIGPALVPRCGWQPRDDRGRDRRGHRGVRRRGAPRSVGRLRRHRDLRRLQRARRSVLDALVEPAHRRVGWLVRRADAFLLHAPRADPCCLRRGFHPRAGRQCGQSLRTRPEGRGTGRDRRLARRAPPDGLRHLRHGLLLRLLPDHPGLAVRTTARRALRGGVEARRAERGRPGGEPHPDTGGGRGGPGRRRSGHGQHRPRPDRRPVPRHEGPRGPRRGRPSVHLLQPAVLGPPVTRLLDLLSRECVGGSRVVGR